jgi:hypothetical protein
MRNFRFSIKQLLVATGLVAIGLFLIWRFAAPAMNKHWAAERINSTGAEVFVRDRGVDLRGQPKNIRRVSVGWDAQALVVARELERLPDINELYLYMRVTDAGLRTICRTDPPLALDTLLLETPRVTNSGLANLTHLKELKTLSCAVPGLDDVGVAHLKAVRGLQHLILREIELNVPVVISEKSLRGVGELDQLTALELKYEGNKTFDLSDASLRHLHRSNGLALLRITRCRISDEAVTELRAALPDCEIKIDPR